MFALKTKMGRLCARAGFLVGASAAVLAIGGVGASSAAAATGTANCNQEGTNIQGIGSSLQRVAQENWTGRAVPSGTPLGGLPHAANALANSYRVKCAAKAVPPTVSYTSTGSGMALADFGYTGPLNTALAFIGTDDGPNAAQIAAAELASGAKPVILPVTQTAIAVIAHPPAGCTLKEITWLDLNKVFGGKGIKKWSDFSTASGGAACEKEITRVVRAEGSGTTLQLKNYLQVLHEEVGAEKLPCETEGTEEWSGLEEVGAAPAEKPNTVWPCPPAEGGTPIVTAEGGGGVATKVETTENTIGYAALPDAKAHTTNVTLEKLQNGTSGGLPKYGEPGNNATSNARCENARYTVPANGRRIVGSNGLAVDWSKVFGAQPKIGGTEYPLCTLTYIAAWNEYKEAKYGAGSAAIEKLTGDFIMNYVVQTAAGQGQPVVSGHWYAALPVGAGVGAASDVQDSAEFIATNLKE
jgi:ABC-type phosphate transport system substrate-binding protein